MERQTGTLYVFSEVMLDVIHTYLMIFRIWCTLLWKIIKYGKKEISYSTCSKNLNFWYLTHQSYLVHTTGLTQNWPSFFHCSLECLKSHHHQVTNLLFNWTSTTYTLGGSRNSFRGLWRWCFWCSKTEKCIFAAVAKNTVSVFWKSKNSHLKIKYWQWIL